MASPPLALPVLRSTRVVLRPLAEDDLTTLVPAVAEDGVREWWGTPEPVEREADGLRNDGCAFAVEAEGALAGWVGFHEELEPDYRHAALDIFLRSGFRDRGIGRKALVLAARWLISERGHHRLTIDPSAGNARAIRTYEAVGFRPVGILRRYERGPDGRWRDGLLMDLLAEELTSSASR